MNEEEQEDLLMETETRQDHAPTFVRGAALPSACRHREHGLRAVGYVSLTDSQFDPSCPTCERLARRA